MILAPAPAIVKPAPSVGLLRDLAATDFAGPLRLFDLARAAASAPESEPTDAEWDAMAGEAAARGAFEAGCPTW